ncbi:MAG: DUF4911 domain-containing protein [Defluviitoga tunisiensis]|jgi:hypothetical protein|uniref:DUF4911 domain-containing protein n=1 Tax=Defluviitoga tunisiensis TaxID=1006576 RepID=A0A0C7NKS6_DEFTU|nr:DUF4911 domain-containing protein [Defluviitoga tunisiensis]MDD3601541.1 DUF4911 domain-containing protein [Defluviitoga tunisiensis]MDY0379603.1 DUF4911 domain-containing protein [Defluviitoga tunisiensis]CEP78506.1 hypothetical protein DTL3_1205 [Defluviitoga tunisiensis]HHV00687.1 DUF4911 domain-containing protein [Defluviitoga tunisiensis]HOB55925.1 DUF4911 domain-containing protein [Defluviitoga tunisiensis]
MPYDNSIPEFDIFIDIAEEDIHLLIYLIEAEAHIMNVRKRQKNGYFKIIVPAGFLDESLILLNSLKKSDIKLEVISVEPHDGII